MFKTGRKQNVRLMNADCGIWMNPFGIKCLVFRVLCHVARLLVTRRLAFFCGILIWKVL